MHERLCQSDEQFLLTFYFKPPADPILLNPIRDSEGWQDISISYGGLGGKSDFQRLAHLGYFEISEDGKKVRLAAKGREYLETIDGKERIMQ